MVRGDSSPHPPGEPSDAGLLSSDLQSSDEFVEADWMASRPAHSKKKPTSKGVILRPEKENKYCFSDVTDADLLLSLCMFVIVPLSPRRLAWETPVIGLDPLPNPTFQAS